MAINYFVLRMGNYSINCENRDNLAGNNYTKITIITIIVKVYVGAISFNKQYSSRINVCKIWLRISCYLYYCLKEYTRLLQFSIIESQKNGDDQAIILRYGEISTSPNYV